MNYKNYSLIDILKDVESDYLVIPYVQRPFIWKQYEIVRFFDSLMQNYPAGSFFLWKTNDEIAARRFMKEIDSNGKASGLQDRDLSHSNTERTFVLDGHQRLQSVYAIFMGGICDDQGVRQEAYVDITGGKYRDGKTGNLHNLVFSSQPLGPTMIRLRDLVQKCQNGNSDSFADDANDSLDGVLQEGNEQRKLRERRVRANVQQIFSLLRDERHFVVYELDGVKKQDTYKTVLDIFDRCYSGGRRLSGADLMFAGLVGHQEGFVED